MRLTLLLIISVSLAVGLVAACHKKEPLIGDKIYSYKYSQTQCADPWGYGGADSITTKAILHFLDSIGVQGPELACYIKGDAPTEICAACVCKTGKTIYVGTMDYTAGPKLIKLGFTQIQY